MPTTDRTVYLTFDDGPTPGVTEFVLQQLKDYDAKATFFCIGQNVQDHPEIFDAIISAGHSVGNHTQNHENGRYTPTKAYVASIAQARKLIPGTLFRPPFGRINGSQVRAIRNLIPQANIILWSVLTADFDTELTAAQCFAPVKKHTQPGSIIVFHDSEKAFPRLKEALPLTLEWLKHQGYACKAIPYISEQVGNQ